MERDTFILKTVDWLNRRVAPEGVTVDADTPLFECGIIDSLGVLRLIAWTEQALGRRIEDREIRMDRFGSVRAIAANFVESRIAAGGRCAASACARCVGCERRAA